MAPVLTIRVDETTRRELEELAAARGTSISALLREHIDRSLGRDKPRDAFSDDAPASLTKVERLLLSQQYRILAAQTGDDDHERTQYLNLAEALERGYTGEYEEVFASIYAELPREECVLLWDILDMFRVLEYSVANLGDDERGRLGKDARDRLMFGGFDGNDSREVRLLVYAQYLIESGRWTEHKHHFERGRGNSHAIMLPKYQRMLQVFEAVRRERGPIAFGPFNLAELQKVAQAY